MNTTKNIDELFQRTEKPTFLWEYDNINEVIGADKRCSNHVLLSFGICQNTPAMRRRDTLNALRNTFGDQNLIHLPNEIDKEREDPDAPIDSILDKHGEILKRTVKDFALKNNEGHFIVFVPRHVVAVHNGVIIDTEKKGFSQRKVDDLFEIRNFDVQIDDAFDAYRETHPENVFTKPKKRKRTPRPVDLIDVKSSLEDEGFRVSYSTLFDVLKSNKIGRVDGDNIRLTRTEAEMVINTYIEANS